MSAVRETIRAPVSRTAIASVWRGDTDAADAALKLFHAPDLSNEGAGLDRLAARDGKGAERLPALAEAA